MDLSAANADAGAEALAAAKRLAASGMYDRALRMLSKAEKLFSDPRALVDLRADIESAARANGHNAPPPQPEPQPRPPQEPPRGPSPHNASAESQAPPPPIPPSESATPAELITRILRLGPREYYAALDLPRTATEVDVKKAFKRASMRIHPDKCSDPRATIAFQRLSEANSVLSDPTQRALHDRSTPSWSQAQTQRDAAFRQAQQRAQEAAAQHAAFNAARAQQAAHAAAAAAQHAAPAQTKLRMERFCTNNYRLSKPQLQAIARWLHLNDGGVKAAIASIVVEYLIGLVPDPNDLSMAEAALHSFREVAVHGSQAHPTDLARVEPIMRAARAQHEAKATVALRP